MSKQGRKMTQARLSAELYKDYKSQRQTWADEAAADQDYYLNKQWTEDEQNILANRGQAALVINRIFPTIQQKLSQLGSHKPVIRALAAEEGDANKAWMWSMMIEYVLQNSGFNLVDIEVKRDHLIQGVGYYHVYVDPEADDGKGEVRVMSLPPEVVYVDPNSRKPDYSDADHIIVSQIYTFAQAKRMFPDRSAALDKAADELANERDYTTRDFYTAEGVIRPGDIDFRPQDDQRKVRIIERYSKVKVPYWVVTRGTGEFHDVVDKERWDAAFKGNPNFQGKKIFRTHVRRYVSAGVDTKLSDVILPIRDYPIIPVPNVWVGTPYPLSDVRYMRGIQDEINKRRSLAIYYMTSSTGPKWLAEKGSIDETEWAERKTVPHAVLTWRPGFEKPAYVFPPQLPSGIFAMESEAKHDLEAVSGVFSVSHGDPQAAPDTYGATLALEEYANRRAGPSAEMFSSAKKVLGRVVIALCREVYTLRKYIRVVGEEGELFEFLVNSSPEDRITNADEQYDVIVEGGRFAPTNRIAYSQFMRDLYQAGVIGNEALIDTLDIPNKQKVKEENSTLSQQQRLIQAQEAENKELRGTLQTFRRQLEQLQIKGVVDNARVQEKSTLLDLERDKDRELNDLRLAVEEHKLKLKAIEEKKRTSAAGGGAATTKEKE